MNASESTQNGSGPFLHFCSHFMALMCIASFSSTSYLGRRREAWRHWKRSSPTKMLLQSLFGIELDQVPLDVPRFLRSSAVLMDRQCCWSWCAKVHRTGCSQCLESHWSHYDVWKEVLGEDLHRYAVKIFELLWLGAHWASVSRFAVRWREDRGVNLGESLELWILARFGIGIMSRQLNQKIL